jgi:hypothetical protein
VAAVASRSEKAGFVPIIDCDTHLDQMEDTWACFDYEELAYLPWTDVPKQLEPNRLPTRYVLINSHCQLRRQGILRTVEGFFDLMSDSTC